MYAAFALFGTRPAAGPDVAPLLHRAGAGPAADRGKAVGDERMLRQVVLGGVAVEVGLSPIGERVELDAPVRLFHHGQAQPIAAVEALAAGDPGRETLERQVERDHLADMAAGVGVAFPEVSLGIA